MLHKVFHLTQKLKPFNKVNKRKLLTVRWSPCVSVIAGEKFNNAGDDFCLKLLVKKRTFWRNDLNRRSTEWEREWEPVCRALCLFWKLELRWHCQLHRTQMRWSIVEESCPRKLKKNDSKSYEIFEIIAWPQPGRHLRGSCREGLGGKWRTWTCRPPPWSASPRGRGRCRSGRSWRNLATSSASWLRLEDLDALQDLLPRTPRITKVYSWIRFKKSTLYAGWRGWGMSPRRPSWSIVLR